MQLGMIGLGRMGANMATRLTEHGHELKTYDPGVETRTAASLAELRDQLDAPRAFWLMIPAGEITENAFQELLTLGDAGDTIVDGGNSNFRDSQRRYRDAQAKNIHFVDAGVSGGIWGLKNGDCLMVGGEDEPVQRLEPVFKDLAPEDGYAHVGASGAGHFTKMVHNGIEYGLMQAYGEGFEILEKSEFDLDLPATAEVWRHSSVIQSWLLDLLARALAEDPKLEHIKGYVDDSGEGRWTVMEAINESVAAPTIAIALMARFTSRDPDPFAMKAIAALRNQFGGHAVVRE